MIIGAPKEIFAGEARVALTPASASDLAKLGYECAIESGAGALAGFSDADYTAAGVSVHKTSAALLKPPTLLSRCARLKRVRSNALPKGKCSFHSFGLRNPKTCWKA